MSLNYRDANVADAEAIDRVFRTSFCDTFAHHYSSEDLEAFLAGYRLDAWRTELSDPYFAFHIAEEHGEAVAYAKLGPVKIPVDDDRPAILLSQLYVLKEHHGEGIAPALMEWVFAEGRQRGKEQLYLTVFTENPRARRFYQRYGFEEIGPYKFMVGNQADEDIIMRKRL